jgi:predicted deacylase
MQSLFSRRTIVVGGILICLALILFFVFHKNSPPIVPPAQSVVITYPIHSVIGHSVQGRTIDAYRYGDGEKVLAFVGGIHGGYEWNSVVLAYQVMDYLQANPNIIPKNITVIVIPSANPDAVYKVVGKEGPFTSADVPAGTHTDARLNADNVDLNRNFACKWQAQSMWQNKTESAGSSAFSEPEARTIENFVLEQRPVATVFWHSQSGNVYASQCENGILPGTLDLMNVYAQGSGYPAMKTFDAYATTGGADDWMATQGLSAVTVELTTHTDVEFDKNLAGIKAMFDYYGK